MLLSTYSCLIFPNSAYAGLQATDGLHQAWPRGLMSPSPKSQAVVFKYEVVLSHRLAESRHTKYQLLGSPPTWAGVGF